MAAFIPKSDDDLLNAFHSGNKEAFEIIYDRYWLMLIRHANHMLNDEEEAKDVVQEVFTKLWATKYNIELDTNLPGFLYTAVRNSILNQFAHKNVQDKYLESILKFAEEGETITDHLVREKQFAQLIEKEISGLSPKMRTVFKLSREEYLSHREIAEKLNLSEQTVSKHVTNALRTLRLKLGIFLYLLWIIGLK